jgi:hypothetical protein
MSENYKVELMSILGKEALFHPCVHVVTLWLECLLPESIDTFRNKSRGRCGRCQGYLHVPTRRLVARHTTDWVILV